MLSAITKDIQRYFNLLDNQKHFTIYNGILSRKSVDFRPKKNTEFPYLEKRKRDIQLRFPRRNSGYLYYERF